MSLRTKLYVAFAAMTVLAAVIGLRAIYAFAQTSEQVAVTRDQVETVTTLMVPVNALAAEIYTDINQASLFYHAFDFSHEAADADNGDLNIKQIQGRLARLEAAFDHPKAGLLEQERKDAAAIRDKIGVMQTKAGEFRGAVAALENVRSEIDADLEAVRGMLEASLAGASAEPRAGMEKNGDSEAGPKPETRPASRPRRSDLLDRAQAELARGESFFLRGVSGSRDRASEQLAEAARAWNQAVAAAEELAAADTSLRPLRDAMAGFVRTAEKYEDAWRRTTEIGTEIDAVSSAILDLCDGIEEASSELVLSQAKEASEATARIDAIVDNSTFAAVVILGAALVIGATLAVLITRGIVGPVNRVIGSLARGEEIISQASAQISAAAGELSEGVSEQAASLEQTSSALEQVASMTRTSADNAKQTSENTRITSQLVTGGAASMRDMAAAMEEINDRTDKISQIIKAIEDIAFQTNLLALNAAVEAARAGEAGKGFAVVADEVRNLSQRSSQAARDTADLINGTVESVRRGATIVEELSGGYREIEEGTENISRLIEQIAVAANEQAQGVDQINGAVSQMDKVTQRNAAGATESAASAQELEEQVADLRGSMALLERIVYGTRGNGHRLLAGGGNGRNGGNNGNGGNRPHAPGGRHKLLSGPMVMRPEHIETDTF